MTVLQYGNNLLVKSKLKHQSWFNQNLADKKKKKSAVRMEGYFLYFKEGITF